MAYKHGTMDVSYEEQGKPHEFKAVILNVYKAKGGVTQGCAILGPQHMRETYPSLEVKLDSVLVATDFSTAAKEAVLYATAIARRHNSKLFIVHVVTSRSESALMDGWRAGQAEIIEQLLANRLDGIEHELVVKPGQVEQVLSRFIEEKSIDLVVVGTRGRTGVLKLLWVRLPKTYSAEPYVPCLLLGRISPAKILKSVQSAYLPRRVSLLIPSSV